MIDVHSHIIPFIDDGSKSMDETCRMIEEEIQEGITDVVCTPHYRPENMIASLETVKKAFLDLQEAVKSKRYAINLYLGREITFCRSSYKLIKEGKLETLNGGKCILIELTYLDEDIDEICYNIKLQGFVPVLAHVERYKVLRNVDVIERLRDSGVLIQVNASSICGELGFGITHFVKKLLKSKNIDFVASDIHGFRKSMMKKAYDIVSKKYSTEYAEEIFTINPKKVIDNEY